MQEAVEIDASADGREIGLKGLVEAYERQIIQSALAASAGNQRRAAAALGLLPTTLHEKMKRLGLLRRSLEDAPFRGPRG
jgi:DNA-binding NtrC family response regulator